jgi:solute carrier family 34 (sodium-dependent phosphate cotransporter)
VSASNPERGAVLVNTVRSVLVLVLLYLFLVGVGMLELGIRELGAGFQEGLLASVDNPLAGLFAGILATVLVQSSSISTSTIVGLVGAGVLPVPFAVPMIMGANIGTTITNTLVSLGSIRRGPEFRRAFAAATMHDFFNLLAVGVLFPLELITAALTGRGVITRIAKYGGDALARAGVTGGEVDSPIRAVVRSAVGLVEAGLTIVVRPGLPLGVVLLVLGIGLLFLTLRSITVNMRRLLAGRIESTMNDVIGRGGGIAGIVIGIVLTIAVVSSTITTSILVPMVAAGILAIRNAYPITLGANIGTTVTALLAALAVELPEGMVIAIVHTAFNLLAIALIYPVARVRYIPVALAERLSARAADHPSIVAVYVIGVFIVVPLAGVALLR